MKILIPIIVIFIIIFFIIIIFNSNIYFGEKFTNKNNDDSIDNPIAISYVPSNPYLKLNLSEYDIIEIYKKILQRSPNIEELKLNVYLTKPELTEQLFNSSEYNNFLQMQDNQAEGGIEGAIAKRNLITKIMSLYQIKYNKDAPVKMLMPLRDCYIHLRSNIYLFTALLESFNYPKFEVEVLSTLVLTKKILLTIFNKYFNLLELKLIAEEKIKQANKNVIISKAEEVIKIKDEINDLKTEINNLTDTTKNNIDLKTFLQKTFPNAYNAIKDTENDVSLKTNTNTNGNNSSSNINEINKYLNSGTGTTTIKPLELYQNLTKTNEEISLKEPYENKKNLAEITENNKNNYKTQETFESNNSKKLAEKIPENAEVYVRIYDPINYKQEYKGKPEFRPPVCTSLGQTQLIQPIFLESKLLFQGTDLELAFKDTQVGSIMPKFIYKEYQDIRVQ